MAGFTQLALRPAQILTATEYDTDMDSEWIKTPSDTFGDEEEVQIDAYGDILLRVGYDTESGESKSFRVCSNALRRASPFWRQALADTAEEAKEAYGDWYWPPSLYACPYEKSDGLLILLNIIHSKFHLVPQSPSLPEIYDVLCLATMYEMEHVLQPWIRQWYDVINDMQASRDGHDLGMLACIALGLGGERLFMNTIIKITLTCVVDKEGHITTDDGVCLDPYIYDTLGSPLIPDNIRSLRNQLAQELPSHLNRLITRLVDGKWMCSRISDIPITKNKKCDYVVLGSIFAGMIYVRGSKATELEIRADESIADLLKSIKRVLSYVSCYEKHTDCNPAERICEAMRETIEDMDTSLGPAITQRMSERRRKTGLEPKSFKADRD